MARSPRGLQQRGRRYECSPPRFAVSIERSERQRPFDGKTTTEEGLAIHLTGGVQIPVVRPLTGTVAYLLDYGPGEHLLEPFTLQKPAAENDGGNLLRVRNVLQGVAVQQDKVGSLSPPDRP